MASLDDDPTVFSLPLQPSVKAQQGEDVSATGIETEIQPPAVGISCEICGAAVSGDETLCPHCAPLMESAEDEE
jgi:hypothetical protein